MEITIIGTGNMARGIATRLLAGSHAVTLVGTSSEKARTLAGELSGDVRAAESRRPSAYVAAGSAGHRVRQRREFIG